MRPADSAIGTATSMEVNPKARSNDVLISEMCKHLKRSRPHMDLLQVNELHLVPTFPPVPYPMILPAPHNTFSGVLAHQNEALHAVPNVCTAPQRLTVPIMMDNASRDSFGVAPPTVNPGPLRQIPQIPDGGNTVRTTAEANTFLDGHRIRSDFFMDLSRDGHGYICCPEYNYN